MTDTRSGLDAAPTTPEEDLEQARRDAVQRRTLPTLLAMQASGNAAVASVVAALIGFLLLWQAVVIVSGFPPFILPPPGSVLTRWFSAWSAGTIQPHLAATLVEVLLGFAVGAGAALAAGYALARSAVIERLASPYLVAAQATPILAHARAAGRLALVAGTRTRTWSAPCTRARR